MAVFRRIYEKLVEKKLATDCNVYTPHLNETELLREKVRVVHCDEYIDDFVNGRLSREKQRRIGLPWSEKLVTRTLSEIAGTMLTAELALEKGLACSCAGGTHHAHRSFGSGFCIFNDLAITSKHLLDKYGDRVERILIVDLDVHQGDGTAAIFQQDKKKKNGSRLIEARDVKDYSDLRHKSVFTLSMHCESNFPARKEASDLDVPLPKGMGDENYLPLLAEVFTKCIREYKPDIVLYDAGVDVHKDDSLGFLELTDEGIFRRDATILDTCVGFGIPVAGYVGGGYSNDLDELALRHCLLFEAASQAYQEHHDNAGALGL